MLDCCVGLGLGSHHRLLACCRNAASSESIPVHCKPPPSLSSPSTSPLKPSPSLLTILPLSSQDKHGEVCPIDWKEGSATIKATPKDSLEYFAAAEKGANGKRAVDEMLVDAPHTNGNANGTAKRVKV